MATQAYLAKLMGISVRRFRELRDEGVLPDAEKGEYDVEVVMPIYCEHLRHVAAGRGASPTAKSIEYLRLMKARADKAEMEAAEMRGMLIPVDQIAGPLHSAVIIMKTRMLAVPSKCAPLVAGVNSITAVERVIRDHIYEALSDLSKVEVIRSAK
jgi:phage terminase Nu1 subunit (DNA packaging protein)